MLTPERLAFVGRVEDAVASVADYDRFCHLTPTDASDVNHHRIECARWVPADVGGDACPNTTCTTPMSILSFEALVRRRGIHVARSDSFTVM